MDEQRGGHMDGTATEGGLGPAAQQAQPEGPVAEGSQATQDAAGPLTADEGNGAVVAPVSGLARLREMFSTPRRERAPRSEKVPTEANIKWAKPMPAPRPSVACDTCRRPTGTLLRVSEGVYRHKGCHPAPPAFRKGGTR